MFFLKKIFNAKSIKIYIIFFNINIINTSFEFIILFKNELILLILPV